MNVRASHTCRRAKYPLAITSKCLEVLGRRLLIGYDIGCTFSKTIASSLLGPQFKEQECRCCVNAFHGYSHNFACQKQNHPNVINGMGLEDLETLERVFSCSNQLARIIRYSTSFRRRLFIDMHFKQWDEDKYLNLGTMLFNNYVQALDIIKTDSVALADAMHSLEISKNDLELWHEEEAKYFLSLGKEPEWDVHAVAYVELLQDLRDAR